MALHKSREQEEFEAFLRASRAYERKLEDIAWKHEKFLPLLNKYKQGLAEINKDVEVFEMESGE